MWMLVSRAANPVPKFLDLLGGTFCLFVSEVGGRKCEEEKWHVLAVVLHARVGVLASHIRIKACYLNQ